MFKIGVGKSFFTQSDQKQKYIGTFNPMRRASPATNSILNRFDHGFFQREILETPIQGVQTPQPQIESHKFIWQAEVF